MWFKRFKVSGNLGKSIDILSKKDQQKLFLVIVVQVLMGLLDLVGVAIIGILGALTVSGVQSSKPGNRVSAVLKFLHLDSFPFQNQAAILGAAAATVLISRTIFSVFFTRKILYFLSLRGAMISSNLISQILAQPLLVIQKRSMQNLIYAVTQGVNAITLGVLGTGVILISDTSLLIVLSIGLFIVDPAIAISSVIAFGTIGYLIYKLMNMRARELGHEESLLSIAAGEELIEVLTSYRESVVRNRRNYYAREIENLRHKSASVLAELAFMPNISKYIIETSVILAGLAISAAQFLMQDASHAIATLAIFLAAGTRIAPAVLRVQQGALSLRSSLGVATPTLELLNEFEHSTPLLEVSDRVITDHVGFTGDVKLDKVTLTYPGQPVPALKNISLTIPSGSSVAFVGPSGAGKTTLVDVLLGVLIQDGGEVKISNSTPQQAIQNWPGAIAYVPQDVSIANRSIRENVALGFPFSEVNDELIHEALSMAQLTNVVSSLSNGIATEVGERGSKLSGGQRQRLGIARAMFTKPKLLVLDEATSALDGETEADISDAVMKLKGDVTVIMIAHRLSTVRHSDLVVYMESGEIVASGTFNEVRLQVPNFDRQAQLMGL